MPLAPSSGDGLGGEQYEISDDPVGDEDLGAIDAIAIAVTHRAGTQTAKIAARIRFGQADGGDRLTGRHPRQPISLLLRRCRKRYEKRRDDVGVHVPGGRREAEATKLFQHNRVETEVTARAAVFLRDAGARAGRPRRRGARFLQA